MKHGRRYLCGVLSVVALMLSAFFIHWLVNYSQRNLHVVLPGRVYRSAQLSPAELATVIKRYHIRTVINLRGKRPSEAWYPAELAVTQREHVQHIDLPFQAHTLPSVAELQQLVQQLAEQPQPLLLHCRQGADRTGLAAALAVLWFTTPTQDQVWHQVSWAYNVLSPSSVGYQVMRNYLAWCDATHCQLGRASLTTWLSSQAALHTYRGVAPWLGLPN